MSNGRNGSHWDGCYETHHDCAVAEIRRLHKRQSDLDADNGQATQHAIIAYSLLVDERRRSWDLAMRLDAAVDVLRDADKAIWDDRMSTKNLFAQRVGKLLARLREV